MTTLDLLKRMRICLGVKEQWTQEASARNIRYEPVRAESEEAVCWCLEGACTVVTPYILVPRITDIVRALRFDDRKQMNEWNDSHNYDEVIQRIDAAIARYEGLQELTQIGQELGGYDDV